MGPARAVGVAAFLVVSLAVGIRLLRLAARTRKLPEAGIGAGFLLSGALGYSLVILPLLFAEMPEPWRYRVAAAGLLFFHLGSAALWLAVWRIFRPEAGWALSLVTAALLLLAVTFVRDALVDRQPIPSPFRTWYWVGLSVRVGPLVWGAVESLRYHAMLCRRMALGLADPATARPFLFWGLGGAAASAMSASAVAMRLAPAWADHPVGVWTSSGLGLVAAALIGCTFFPTRAMRRRLAAGAAVPGPSR